MIRNEALDLLSMYHGYQAEQIHDERAAGLHLGESWRDCPSMICSNARWDIDQARAIATKDPMAVVEELIEEQSATAVERVTLASRATPTRNRG